MSSPTASVPASSSCDAPVLEHHRSLLMAPASAPATIALQSCLPMRLTPVEDTFRPFFSVRNLFFFPNPAAAATADPSVAAASASEKDLHVHPFMNTRRMEAALRRLLRSYPILCARLEFRMEDGSDPATVSAAAAASASPVVTSLAGGVSWVCSSCPSLRLDQLPLGSNFPGPNILPAQGLIEPLIWDAPLSVPLVSLTHTRFACGGVCLGLSMQHYLADGEGYFRLVHDLAELYRSQPLRPDAWTDAELDTLPSLQVQPCLDRSWLQPSPAQLAESRAAQERTVGGFHVVPASAPSSSEPEPPSSLRVIRFEAAEIAAMKREACARSGQPWLSSFEVLAAHVARCIYRARTADLDPSTADREWPSMRLDIASNLRGDRLAPRSDSEALLVRSHEILFGNAVLPAVVELPRADLVDHSSSSSSAAAAPLSALADSIHASLASQSSAATWRTLSWLASQADKACIWSSIEMSKGLILSAWSKFRAHDVYFETAAAAAGEAEPVPVRPLRICPSPRPGGQDGLATLLDTPARDGSIDLCVAMRVDHGDAMLRSKELHRFRTEAKLEQ